MRRRLDFGCCYSCSLVFLFAVTFASEISAAGPATPCLVRSLLENNSQLFPEAQEYIGLPDGFAFRNPRYTGPHSSSPSSAKLRSRQQVEALFERIKTLLIQEISGGKKDLNLSSDQRIMIERLRSQSLRFRDCRGLTTAPGSNSLDDQITVCDQVRGSPELALVALIGHELGHIIDFQNLASARYRVKTPGVNFQRILGLNPDSGSTDLPLIPSEISRSQHFLERKIPDEDLRHLQTLLSRNHVELAEPGVPAERHVGLPVQACLERFHGYRRPIDPKRDRQFGETGAQIWGARAVARFLESKPEMDRLQVLAIIAHSVSGLGKSPGAKEIDINAIYFSEPALATRLGCQPDTNQNCMTFFSPAGSRSGFPVDIRSGVTK